MPRRRLQTLPQRRFSHSAKAMKIHKWTGKQCTDKNIFANLFFTFFWSAFVAAFGQLLQICFQVFAQYGTVSFFVVYLNFLQILISFFWNAFVAVFKQLLEICFQIFAQWVFLLFFCSFCKSFFIFFSMGFIALFVQLLQVCFQDFAQCGQVSFFMFLCCFYRSVFSVLYKCNRGGFCSFCAIVVSLNLSNCGLVEYRWTSIITVLCVV